MGMNPNFVGYCCRNPKGPHKFPKGHPKLPGAEQNEKPQEANVAAEKANVAAEQESTDFAVPSSVGDEPCDFSTGGAACCNGKGQEVIGSYDYCMDLVKYGECVSKDACFQTRLNKDFVGFCCRNPKGPHKFPKGHPRLPHAEQNEKTQKANVATEKANV